MHLKIYNVIPRKDSDGWFPALRVGYLRYVTAVVVAVVPPVLASCLRYTDRFVLSMSGISPDIVWRLIALNAPPQIDNMTIVGLSGASAGVLSLMVWPGYRFWPNIQTDTCY